MRIRTAIFIVYVAASALGFAVLMRFVLAEVRPRYLRALQGNLAETAQLLATAWNGRRLPANPQALAAPGGELRVRVFDHTGAVTLDSGGAEPAPGAPVAVSAARHYARAAGDQLIDGPADPDLTELRGTAPVDFSDGQERTLVVSRPIRSVNRLVWGERRRLAGIGLVVAGVMVVAGWWIAHRLTRSLVRLTDYVKLRRDGGEAPAPRSRAREIADLTQAFEELRVALEGRQKVERYTQVLAHEVKAPLSAIRGAAELLTEPMSEPQREKFLGNIRQEASRIQQLVERLLELSTLEARPGLHEPADLDFGGLVADAVAGVAGAAAASSVDVEYAPPPTALPITGERTLLRAAVLNLLQNAIEFSPPRGRVAVRALLAADGRRACVIEDEGPGIPPYARERIFERFYSLPRPGSGRKSTGLGLALAREIAHRHGGEVTLVNRSGRGARAELVLPARAGP